MHWVVKRLRNGDDWYLASAIASYWNCGVLNAYKFTDRKEAVVKRDGERQLRSPAVRRTIRVVRVHTREDLRREREALRARVRELEAKDTSWPLADVLEKLIGAAHHLLRDHDCDAHGYEGINAALDSARRLVVIARGGTTPPPSEPVGPGPTSGTTFSPEASAPIVLGCTFETRPGVSCGAPATSVHSTHGTRDFNGEAWCDKHPSRCCSRCNGGGQDPEVRGCVCDCCGGTGVET